MTDTSPYWKVFHRAFLRVSENLERAIALISLICILAHLAALYLYPSAANWPLLFALIFGGGPLVYDLMRKALRGEFGADMLAGIAIVTALFQGHYLAGAIVVLMLSGGEALERYAVRRASSVLSALAKRMPTVAHRKTASGLIEVPVSELAVGDEFVVLPHEAAPADGIVIEGRGSMDEAYLTGEPFLIEKVVGSTVQSGAINGESALTVRAVRRAIDSRYAQIMKVMELAEERKPPIRRLGDNLGAAYTPLALMVAFAAWWWSGDATRFLAVLVVATPCPLLIAIPTAIIGAISLAAKRGIVIKDPGVLEQASLCRAMILDKTGTLTYGRPHLNEERYYVSEGPEILQAVASIERYSRHPLAGAIIEAAAAKGLAPLAVSEVSEPPGQGLTAKVAGREYIVTSRKKFIAAGGDPGLLPELSGGLECVILRDGDLAAYLNFRDTPRKEGESFISHLNPKHKFQRILIVSGDRESEVRYLADRVGIQEIHAGKSPEEKLAIVGEITRNMRTIYVGDGINDAPALVTATVGIAMGQVNDVTTASADVIIMDSSLTKIDEFLHVGARMRTIALQSAIGGIALSVGGMFFAAAGLLPPVLGALSQEAIDLLAVGNALRMSLPPERLTDFSTEG